MRLILKSNVIRNDSEVLRRSRKIEEMVKMQIKAGNLSIFLPHDVDLLYVEDDEHGLMICEENPAKKN